MDIEYEARSLASKLDHSRGNEVANKLQQDSQYLDPRSYSALLQTINRYEQKGVGDDLIIVNNNDGTREALIKTAPIDVGRILPEAPPPQYYQRGSNYPQEGYAPPPPRNDGCTIASAGAGALVGNVFAPNGRRGAGTAIGAVAGALIGNDRCNR